MSKNSGIHIYILILKPEYYYVLKWEILQFIQFPKWRLNLKTLVLLIYQLLFENQYQSPIFMTVINIS